MDLKEVNEIRSQIGQLESKMREARARLEQAGLKALGLCVGDRIEHSGRGSEMIAEVTGCEVNWGEPRPTGKKVKKDGSVSSISAGYISEWRKV